MRIAFYAPMKPPDSPVPSGDREIARSLMRALELGNHEVALASRFISRDGRGDRVRQERLARIGAWTSKRLLRRWYAEPAGRPDLWFTYHLYHKAPDYLGPGIAAALGIPYVVAEASHAPKQSGGPWDAGYRAAEDALRAAHAVIGLSSLDAACVRPLLLETARYHDLPPMTDTERFAAAGERRTEHRTALRSCFGWPEDATLLMAVGMMRPGDKLASYRALAAALERLDPALDWRLAVVGNGPARPDVEMAFRNIHPGRVGWIGAVAPDELPWLYAAADILAWPAINEAYGVSLLEAQAAGLPVVAGRAGGVADIVRDGRTGLLTPEGDVGAFAAALARLIGDPREIRRMRGNALRIVPAAHGLNCAAAHLDEILAAACEAAAGDRHAA